MTTHQQDLVSWLAFPEVPQWSSFAPQLIFRLSGAQPSMRPDEVIDLYETDSLVGALDNLESCAGSGVQYLAVPLGADRGRRVAYELSIEISDPYRARPRRLADDSDSVLWCPSHDGHAYFALYREARFGVVKLVVGGDSPEACHQIWEIVGQWVRRLYRIRFPHSRSFRHVDFPLETRLQRARRRQAFQQRVREVVLAAEVLECKRKPFHIKGRGHEPRVRLSRELATALRGAGLHRYTTTGYGGQSHYPARVFVRAAKMLESEFGRPMIKLCGVASRCGKVYFA